MRLGITEFIDCAHHLPGHPKWGPLHGHTYKVEVIIEGQQRPGGMILDFTELKTRPARSSPATTTRTGTTSWSSPRSRTSASSWPASSASASPS